MFLFLLISKQQQQGVDVLTICVCIYYISHLRKFTILCSCQDMKLTLYLVSPKELRCLLFLLDISCRLFMTFGCITRTLCLSTNSFWYLISSSFLSQIEDEKSKIYSYSTRFYVSYVYYTLTSSPYY
jgi:hypothetical protein